MAGTIFDNIVGSSNKYSLDDAWDAVELAGLKSDIKEMPMGMHTIVNQGGTTYSVQCIPYNEFGYVNRFNFLRTAGTIEPKGKKMNFVVQALEDILNRQTSEEMRDGLVEKPDKYFACKFSLKNWGRNKSTGSKSSDLVSPASTE